MKVRPLHDRVVVEKVKAPETSSTGAIFLAERFQDSQIAVVIAVGEGRSYDGPGKILADGGVAGRGVWLVDFHRQEPRLHPGDVVMFGIHSGTRVSVGDKEHFLLREDEVVAVLEDLDGHLAGEATRILGGKGNGS